MSFSTIQYMNPLIYNSLLKSNIVQDGNINLLPRLKCELYPNIAILDTPSYENQKRNFFHYLQLQFNPSHTSESITPIHPSIVLHSRHTERRYRFSRGIQKQTDRSTTTTCLLTMTRFQDNVTSSRALKRVSLLLERNCYYIIFPRSRGNNKK